MRKLSKCRRKEYAEKPEFVPEEAQAKLLDIFWRHPTLCSLDWVKRPKWLGVVWIPHLGCSKCASSWVGRLFAMASRSFIPPVGPSVGPGTSPADGRPALQMKTLRGPPLSCTVSMDGSLTGMLSTTLLSRSIPGLQGCSGGPQDQKTLWQHR